MRWAWIPSCGLARRGEDSTCALLADATLRCWGLNGAGQTGDQTTLQRSTPVGLP